MTAHSRLATNDDAAAMTMPVTATRAERARAKIAMSTKTKACTPCGAPETRSSRYPVAKATMAADEMLHLPESPTCMTTSRPRLGAAIRTGASSSTVDCRMSSRYATNRVIADLIVALPIDHGAARGRGRAMGSSVGIGGRRGRRHDEHLGEPREIHVGRDLDLLEEADGPRQHGRDVPHREIARSEE